jgi:hypothetical protein
MSRYCKLYNWVKVADPELAEAVEDLCLIGNFATKRDWGLSFIMPEAKLKKEIIGHAYGPTPEKAIDLINAHIIHENLAEHTGETSNKAGYKVHVKKDGDKMVVGELVVQKAKDFSPMTGRRISAWHAVSGAPTLSGARAERKFDRKKPQAKQAKTFTDKTHNARRRLINDIQNAYTEAVIANAAGGEEDPHARAAEVVASVEGQLRLAAAGGDEDARAATTILHSTIDDNPTVSALMLLNPNQQMNQTLVAAYNKLGDNIGLSVADASDYSKILGRASASASGAGEAVRDIRRRITAIADSSGTATGPATAAIVGAYEDLYRDNRVGDVSGVFSETASSEFRKTGGAAALLRDLMRHDIATSLTQLENDVSPTTADDIRQDVSSVFNRALAVYGGSDESSVQKGLHMFTASGGQYVRGEGDAANAFDEAKIDFLNSSDFLYHPATEPVVAGGAEASYFYNRKASAPKRGGFDVSALRAQIQALE